MAGIGKNPRHGKRPPSSTTSYFSTLTMVVLVAFCLIGVWMLFSSSSSDIPSQATTTRLSRGAKPLSSRKYPPPTIEAEQTAEEEDNRAGSKILEEKEESLDTQEEQSQQDEELKRPQHEDQQMTAGDQEQQADHQQDTNAAGDQQQEINTAAAGDDQQQETTNAAGDQQQEINNAAGGDQQQETNAAGDTAGDQQQEIHVAAAGDDQQQETTNAAGDQQQEINTAAAGDDQQQETTNAAGDQQQEINNAAGGDQQQETNAAGDTAGDQQQEINAAAGGDQQQETNAAAGGDQQQLDGGEEQQQQTIQQGMAETQQQLQTETQSGEENQQQTAQEAHDEQQPEQQQEQGGIDFDNQQQTQQSQGEQQTATEDLENQQQQETGSNIDASQQEDQTQQSEINENHDRIEPHIEEVTTESNPEVQQQSDIEGNGGQQQSDDKFTDNPNSNDLLPDATQSEVLNNGDGGGKKKAWATQADQSENQKERQMGEQSGYEWELCNVTAGPDYIPCLDNEKAIKQIHIKHYEHRERHCPEESPSCLVPLPNGYRHPIEWPMSRDKIWYNNVPHTKLAEVKGHQNWVKVTGEYLTFPGGGTQFIHGALHYIDFIQQSVHDIAWGKHTRVVLDVGCGVASFGGYLFERDVLTMSFAPKDEHEAQVQLALERGIPAMSAVMGSQRLPFPSRVFDLVHCARCRVPWHADGGMLLLELNRVLRPGGYFVWSATPVYQRLKEDVEIWKAMKSLTVSMCWDLISIKKDKLNSVGAAFFRKPVSNDCYDNRKHHSPPMCKEDDDPNAAWYIPLKTCMHRVPVDVSERGSKWPEQWPQRLKSPPYWLNGSQIGVYGKPAPDDFQSDYEHWKRVVTKSYLTGFGINWSKVRNVMDMRAVYGGFSAALRDLKVWSLNVVNIDSPDTLPVIYERGLFGIYHDWCESFSTYPRTYDLLHADHLFSKLKKRCKIVPALAEVDRIVRPGGKLIVRDESRIITEVENLLKSLHWEVHLTFSKGQEGILCAEKSDWRPEKFSDSV